MDLLCGVCHQKKTARIHDASLSIPETGEAQHPYIPGPPDPNDYSHCRANVGGKHGPLRAGVDPEIENTHISVECAACGITTGFPIAEIADRLEWN